MRAPLPAFAMVRDSADHEPDVSGEWTVQVMWGCCILAMSLLISFGLIFGIMQYTRRLDTRQREKSLSSAKKKVGLLKKHDGDGAVASHGIDAHNTSQIRRRKNMHYAEG